MQENESPISELNDDVILPDGWEHDDSLFTLPEDTGYGSTPSDGTDTESPAPDAAPDHAAGTDSAPDTGDSADGGDPASKPEDVPKMPQDPPQDPPKYKYTIRVNHKTQEIELTEQELIARLQKSYAADEKASRDRYRAVYNEQIAAGMSDAAARLIAKDATDGKSYKVDDDDDTNDDSTSDSLDDGSQAANADTARDAGFRADMQRIRDIYPDFDTVPKDVLEAVAKGDNLLAAYVKYRNEQTAQKSAETVQKETAALKKQNAALNQRIRTAQQAPVKGVSSGGNPSAPEQQPDPFLSGFDDNGW